MAGLVVVLAYIGHSSTAVWSASSSGGGGEGRWESVYYRGTLALLGVAFVRVLLLYPLTLLWGWMRKLQDSTNVAMTKVSSSETMTRIRSTVSCSSVRLMSLAGCLVDRSLVISGKDCFLPLEEVERLSLADVKDVFRYASEVGKQDFDRRAFCSSLSPRLRKVLNAMDRVTAESGGGAYLAPAQADDESIDALHLAAAVRIFAEWRSLRLVPPTCKPRYSFAMGLARRDLIQNVQKIEIAAHSWMIHTCEEGNQAPSSPTVRQILEFEVSRRMHHRLPVLADKSGASGVLWTKRQVQYQTRLLANVSQIPVSFPTTSAAVTAAYKATYEDYHGFLVKQIFQRSFEAAPQAQEILCGMNPLPSSTSADSDTVAETDEWSHAGTEVDDNDIDDGWLQIPVETTTSDPSHDALLSQAAVAMAQIRTENPLDRVGTFFEEHWIKLQSLIGQCVGVQVDNNPIRNALQVHVDGSHDVEGSVRLTKEALHAADNVIPSFVAVMEPLLDNLERLIAELNMNDPTKI